MKNFQSVHELLMATVDANPDGKALSWVNDDKSIDGVSWSELSDQVDAVARSLIALGVEAGDKVDILSITNYRWALCDLGITTAGSATVGIYPSLLAKDCAYIVDHSDAVVVFAEDMEQLAKLKEVREDIPKVRKVVLFSGSDDDEWVLSFEDFLALGKDIDQALVNERVEAIQPSDIAGIVYTSGTTGVPKGAALTHDNICFTAQSVLGSVDIKGGDRQLLFLPLAHVFARTCLNAAILAGVNTVIGRGVNTLVEDLSIVRPHWFASVPRVFEKVYAKVNAGAEAKGGLALKIFRWACGVGNEVSDLKLARQPISAMTELKYAIANKLVFQKLQGALGGEVRWCISGAAPLNATIAKFFHAADVLVLEGIGMTENTSFTNLNRIDNYRFGWVGTPGPGIEQKVAEDGEVLFRGRNIMQGYYKMPEATAETISEDGWLHTGDLGEIDEAGFLRITGRKKDLIITAGGKNVAPVPIEGLIATSKYINQACVVGDKKKFLVALIVIDEENVGAWARENGVAFDSLADLQSHDKVKKMLEGEVAKKNKDLASYETIKYISVVDEFTIDNGMLTPTLKVKRAVAMKRHSDTIEAMYPQE